MIASVLDYVDKTAVGFPQKTGFVELEKNISFLDFRENILRRVHNLMIHLGDDIRQKPIAVMQEKGISELVTFMAIAWTGNIYVPFDTEAPAERLKTIIDFLNPVLIISDDKNYEKSLEIKKGCLVLTEDDLDLAAEIDADKLEYRKKQIIDTDPLYIICTSGSTGTPKGVVVSHRAVIDYVEETSEKLQLKAADKIVSQVPFYFDVSVFDIYCTIRNASELHIVPQVYYTFPARIIQYIITNRINTFIWVPSVLINIANLKLLENIDAGFLTRIMFAGEVMPNKQLNKWRKYIPDAMYINYYGPTETTCTSTYYIVDREFKDDEPLPIGKAAYNTRVYILDEVFNVVKRGETGELFIEGSGLALGYYNNPEKTNEAFIQNPLNKSFPQRFYRTGDLVRENEHGELIYVGRRDNQIKHMGYRIELGEIETAVNGIEQIDISCCLYDGEKKEIVLYYAGGLSESELVGKLREKVPVYMLPKIVNKMDALPLNANGKINRNELKRML